MQKLVSSLLLVYALSTAAIVVLVFLGYDIPVPVTILMTVLAFSFAVLHGSLNLGWGRMLLFVFLTFAVSLLFESFGVATGLVYGPYHYTPRLGPMFLGLVPYIIPLAWFMMMYPAWFIAVKVVPARLPAWKRMLAVAAIGGVVMTAWDLAMDPLMVSAGHWVWDVEGAYFGIPLQNYWGWWLTSFVTLALFMLIARPLDLFSRPDNRPTYSYAATGLSSVFSAYAIGLAGPAMAGLFAMLPWVLWGLFSDHDR